MTRYERFAQMYGVGPGHQYILECEVCGYLEWNCTYKDQPDAVTVSSMTPQRCPACVDIATRYPELFNWLGRALAKRDAELRREQIQPDIARPADA